jgi:thermitase
MKNSNLFLVVSAAFVVLCGSIIVLTPDHFGFFKSRDRNTQSVKKTKGIDGRSLELGRVQEQIDAVANEPSALFNDPAIKQAWGLRKSDAGRAWTVSQGSRKVVVAVIDTGLDLRHEDLRENLWRNPGETGLDAKGRDKTSNGIDDDNNGYVDDVHGWNFVAKNHRLDDNHGHGTHIAGIIGAEAGNKKGISGISPQVSLMILKYFDPKVPNTDNLRNTIASINYAVKMGAHIINYSGGGTDFSQEEQDAVVAAERKGILFVAAAGNERSNSDELPYYPADYKLKNIISVTAIDPTTEVLASSNYGVESVDIAAPGQNILSCLPGSTYGLMTGTSQATAFVTGAAVLVMAHKNLYGNPNEIKKYILATGDTSQSLVAKTKTSRQLNLFKALTILDGDNKSITGVKTDVRSREVLAGQDNRSKNQQDLARSTGGYSDPNLAGNENLSEVTKFGRNFMRALDRAAKPTVPTPPKEETPPERLATEPEASN